MTADTDRVVPPDDLRDYPKQSPGEIENIHYHLRKTKVGVCEWCDAVGVTEIAYMRHPWPYTRDRRDYAELCRICHTTLDDYWLGMPRLQAARAQTHCKRGHELNEENTYVRSYVGKGVRQCRVCRREAARAYREQNKEEFAEYQRAYREQNRDKINAQQRVGRARRKAAKNV